MAGRPAGASAAQRGEAAASTDSSLHEPICKAPKWEPDGQEQQGQSGGGARDDLLTRLQAQAAAMQAQQIADRARVDAMLEAQSTMMTSLQESVAKTNDTMVTIGAQLTALGKAVRELTAKTDGRAPGPSGDGGGAVAATPTGAVDTA